MVELSSRDERTHWPVIAQAEGILSVRYRSSIDVAAIILRAEAALAGWPVSRLATAIVQAHRL